MLKLGPEPRIDPPSATEPNVGSMHSRQDMLEWDHKGNLVFLVQLELWSRSLAVWTVRSMRLCGIHCFSVFGQGFKEVRFPTARNRVTQRCRIPEGVCSYSVEVTFAWCWKPRDSLQNLILCFQELYDNPLLLLENTAVRIHGFFIERTWA